MANDEHDPRKQLKALWAGKWLIAGSSILGLILGGGIAYLLPPQYEGTVEMAPVSSNSSNNGLSSTASEITGFAALAGLSTGADSAKNEALATLQSEYLTERYIRENNLLPILYSQYWDASTNAWKKDVKQSKIPTLWKANRDFDRKIRKINTAKTGIVLLMITWRDPKIAADWANGLVRMANEYLRDKAIRQAEQNMAFLNAEAAKTNIVEAREAIYSILKSEINKAMIARGSEEYSFKIIDPATVSELPASPKKSLWALAGAVAGFALSVFFLTARYSLRNDVGPERPNKE